MMARLSAPSNVRLPQKNAGCSALIPYVIGSFSKEHMKKLPGTLAFFSTTFICERRPRIAELCPHVKSLPPFSTKFFISASPPVPRPFLSG
jgi:hypothetical protein